jgi:hypothetical protein
MRQKSSEIRQEQIEWRQQKVLEYTTVISYEYFY